YEMNIPKFTAQASLYRTSRHYRMTATFDDTYGTMCPALSITHFVKISPDLLDFYHSVSWVNPRAWATDLLDPIPYINPWACCENCLASFPCADESCRRQRLSFCTHKCDAYAIGGCACPPGRTVCKGQCCREGEVVCTTDDGCCSPDQACNNRCCPYGTKCTPVGCCLWDSVVC